MAGRIRQLASETAVYGVSSIFARAVNFLLFPFYSNVFAPDVYGPIIVVYAAFVFLNILYQYGMESAYLKYAADAPGTEARTRAFSTAVTSLGLTSVALSALLVLGRDAAGPVIGLEPQFRHLLGYAAVILLLDTLAVVPYAELRLSNRPWYFAFVHTMSVLVNVALNLWLILGAGMGIEAILVANVAASAVAVALLGPVFARNLRPRFDRAGWRAMLRFGLPFVPGGLGYALTERVNIFFLERMPADRVLALYGDAMPASTRAAIDGGDVHAAAEYVVGAYGGMVKLAIFMALAVQMFRFAWQPFFLQRARDEDAPELFGRVFLVLTAGVLLVLLGVSFFARELVSIPLPGGRHLVAESYWVGLVIVPIALVGYAFQGWYYHFSAGAYLTETTRYFVPCTLAGSAVAVVVNAVFVPVYGMTAAAWATTAAYAVMALLLLALVRRRYAVAYPWGRVLPLVALAAAMLVAWLAVPALQVWWAELAMVGVFGAAAYGTVAPRRRTD
jgi:O-antigen/teichoic acid export membrane protein